MLKKGLCNVQFAVASAQIWTLTHRLKLRRLNHCASAGTKQQAKEWQRKCNDDRCVPRAQVSNVKDLTVAPPSSYLTCVTFHTVPDAHVSCEPMTFSVTTSWGQDHLQMTVEKVMNAWQIDKGPWSKRLKMSKDKTSPKDFMNADTDMTDWFKRFLWREKCTLYYMIESLKQHFDTILKEIL